jgi:hypothetical protein
MSVRRVSIALSLLLALAASGTAAQSPSSAARCQQLMDAFDRFYPRYGRGSSGSGTQLDRGIAEVQCARGQYADGIRTLEAAMKRNLIPIPPP